MKRLFGALLLVAGPRALALVWGVSLGLGAAAPFGDYYGFAGYAPVAEGRLIFCITPNLNFMCSCPYRFGHGSDRVYGDLEPRYRVVPALVGLDYRFEFLPYMPYIGGGFAVVESRVTVPFARVPPGSKLPPFQPPAPIVEGREERRVKRFGGYLEGGLEYYLAQAFGLDFRARLLYAYGGDKTYYYDFTVEGGNYVALDGVVGDFWYPVF